MKLLHVLSVGPDWWEQQLFAVLAHFRESFKVISRGIFLLLSPGCLWEKWDKDCREHLLLPGSLKLFALLEKNLPGIHASSCLACHDGSFFFTHAGKAPHFWKQSWEFGSILEIVERMSVSDGMVNLNEFSFRKWLSWFESWGLFNIHVKACDVPRLWSQELAQNPQMVKHQALGFPCCGPCVDAALRSPCRSSRVA